MNGSLRDYLKTTNVIVLYPEFNEIIATVYRILIRAFEDHADTLIAQQSSITWYQADKQLGKYEGPGMPPRTVGYHETLLNMLEFDEFVLEHIQVVKKDDNTVMCHLIE